jgi:hypothetical protein
MGGAPDHSSMGKAALTFEPGRRFTVPAIASYRISQLADRVGVPATTPRFYETAGLLSAERSPSGYRVYALAAAEQDCCAFFAFSLDPFPARWF